MAGQIKSMITRLIRLRVGDNPHMEAPLKIKLIMKGVDPDLFDSNTPDNPIVVQKIVSIAKEMGYELD